MKQSLLVLLLVLAGCTHTRTADFSSVATRDEVNFRADRGHPVIHIKGEPSRQALALQIAADSATWIDKKSGEARAASTSSVEAVAFRRDGYGALEGAAIGTVAGGALMAWSATQDDFSPAFAAVIGAIGGQWLGALIGAIHSDKVVYQVHPVDVAVLEDTSAPCPGLPLACAVLEAETVSLRR